MLEFFLDIAHSVITKVARQPAAKARHTWGECHFETLLVFGNKFQRVALRSFSHYALRDDFGTRIGTKATGAKQRAGGQADKAVAAKTLAAYNRLQQEAVLPAVFGVRQFQIQRQGRFKVGKGFQHQWDAVVALLHEAVEFEFGHHGKAPLHVNAGQTKSTVCKQLCL